MLSARVMAWWIYHRMEAEVSPSSIQDSIREAQCTSEEEIIGELEATYGMEFCGEISSESSGERAVLRSSDRTSTGSDSLGSLLSEDPVPGPGDALLQSEGRSRERRLIEESGDVGWLIAIGVCGGLAWKLGEWFFSAVLPICG